jgi:hypothetical protein
MGLPALMAVSLIGALGSVIAPSAAYADTTVTCVPVDVNNCTITIALTSDMNEELSSTMPDSHPWYLNELEGNAVHAPYEITDPGWDGSDANTSGHVWDGQLTTGDNEPAGGTAILTFRHLKPTSKPYVFDMLSVPSRTTHGAAVTVSASVTPKPKKGHLLLQCMSRTKWKELKALSYNAHHKIWVAHLKWTATAHTVVTCRLQATASTGFATTNSHTFRVRTT